MRINFTLFISCILFLCYSELPAQTGTGNGIISGKILREDGNPLDYATVSLLMAKDSSLILTALTDIRGEYVFSGVKPEIYVVSVSSVGYAKSRSSDIILSQEKLSVNVPAIKLQQEAKTLKEVTVTVQKPFIERKADKLIMNVENSSVSAGSTALEVLLKAPGITVDKDDNIALKGKQGVMVTIDGKQTYMSNADLANMLRNMQSNEIESVEIITNPSSRYDAAGNSGIINIKLKKNKNFGSNGTLTAGAGYGRNYKANGGFSVNTRNKHINLFGNYNYSNNKRENDMQIDRENRTTTETLFFNQTSYSRRNNQNNNFKAGLDYFINKSNTIGALVTGYINGGNELNNNNTLIGPGGSRVDSSLVAVSNGSDRYRNFTYNLNFKSVLDTLGKEISADIDHSHYYGKDRSLYDNSYFDAGGQASGPADIIRNSTPSFINVYSAKVDYSYPVRKSFKIEAGLKSSWVETDNDFQFTQFTNNSWTNDSRRSNHFVYKENVNAAYFNLTTDFKKTNVQIGFRAEQTNSKGDLVTTADVVERSYFNLFPSAFINHTFTDDHSMGLSYSRRINRPSYSSLNPFEYYLDKYTFNKGNPFLNPEYSNSYELSYTYKKTYIITIGYSLTTDVITEVLLPDTIKKALYQTNKNLAKQINYSAGLNAPLSVTKWWKSNNNITLFYLGFRSPDLEGTVLNSGKTSFQLFSGQQFKLTSSLSAELNGDYQSSLIYGTFKIEPQYGIDLGISKSMVNKKLNIKLALNDVFNTRKQRLSSVYEGLNYDLVQKHETQIGRITLSYRFGNSNIKAERQRNTGLDSETKRMKN